MAFSDKSRESLIPSFLYSTSATRAMGFNRFSAPTSTPAASPAVGGGSGSFMIQAPKEKIEMYSPAFYAACTAGGIASCGLTHMAVTPLDLVKCNMQVRGKSLEDRVILSIMQHFSCLLCFRFNSSCPTSVE